MLLTHKRVTKIDNVHPDLLKNVTITSLIKMLRFGQWVEYRKRQDATLDDEGVINEEMKFYKDDINRTTYFKGIFIYLFKSLIQNIIYSH
jgi:hypothetical protein